MTFLIFFKFVCLFIYLFIYFRERESEHTLVEEGQGERKTTESKAGSRL